MRRALTVGITYTGDAIDGVEIDNLGLCRPDVGGKRAADPLYEYDAIIINPESYTHFLFGKAGKHSRKENELELLYNQNYNYRVDISFDHKDRSKEMKAAIARGTTVVWCLSKSKFDSFRRRYYTVYIGYAAPMIAKLVERSGLFSKKGRKMGCVDPNSPFMRYFDMLAQKGGWTQCLTKLDEGYASMAETPEGYSLGGQVMLDSSTGWLLTPPSSQEARNQLVHDCLALKKNNPTQAKYQSIFLSHTSDDKAFVRQLRADLNSRGVEKVWLDEAEIEIGDSLLAKIEEGMKRSKYIAVVLSGKSIDAPWVKKELEMAMNREITSGEVVVLPLLIEKCELPSFLKGKLYADFSNPKNTNQC